MYNKNGSAFVYILIAIALLAALTVTTMQSSSQSSQTQNATKIVSELNSQVGFIQSAVQECIISHPGGDDDVNDSSGPGANTPYPIRPNASYLASSATNRNVKHIGCPGNPGNSDTHADIFGGSSGRFLPPPPDLFNDWKWYNGEDGVFFWIATDKSDPFIKTAYDKLDDKLSKCQLDTINATGGSDKALTNAGDDEDPQCLGGQRCLRYWLVLNSGAAHEDSPDCP